MIANSDIPNDDAGAGGTSGGRSNRAPNAVIAPLPQSVEATEIDGIMLSLNGLLSTDPDLDSLTYAWSINGQSVAQSVTADVKLRIGTNSIRLTVTDGRGGVGVANATVQVLPRSLSVKSVSPSRLTRNNTTTVVISGTGFSERATVFVTGGAVFAESYFSRSESAIVVSIKVASSASSGTREIIVINPDGKTASLRSALVIQ